MYRCECCGQEYDDLELMRYNPYEKTRYCIDCYERITNRKIYKPVQVDKMQRNLLAIVIAGKWFRGIPLSVFNYNYDAYIIALINEFKKAYETIERIEIERFKENNENSNWFIYSYISCCDYYVWNNGSYISGFRSI